MTEQGDQGPHLDHPGQTAALQRALSAASPGHPPPPSQARLLVLVPLPQEAEQGLQTAQSVQAGQGAPLQASRWTLVSVAESGQSPSAAGAPLQKHRRRRPFSPPQRLEGMVIR